MSWDIYAGSSARNMFDKAIHRKNGTIETVAIAVKGVETTDMPVMYRELKAGSANTKSNKNSMFFQRHG